jgi:putative radical SAM enzyme (TIGR03279 family)
MLQIVKVQPGSIAEEVGIQANDFIVAINDHEINDDIDYRFNASEEKIEILIKRAEQQLVFEIEKNYHDDIGIELKPMKMKACGNNCIFCFVYQNPRGMRKPLYFKDEDYRFSFLYGHYVTLTRLNENDLNRIVTQRLSPLYISVHSTEEETRKLLLGINRDDSLLQKIEFLVQGGIELHTQIVLCPGINDGKVFDKTIADLKKFYPGVKSVAIVPVGLTRHRENLYPLRIHSKDELRKTIEYINFERKKLQQELGSFFTYLADEFFIKAESRIPQADYYESFYQIENGVGEFRYTIDNFLSEFPNMPKEMTQPLKITWVTGTLAFQILQDFIITKLNTIKNLQIELIAVENRFYGKDITVSGLLVGEDIYDRLKSLSLGDLLLLPPRILNHQGLLLDDWTLPQLEQKLQVSCYVYKDSLAQFVDVINTLQVHT